MDFPSRTRQRQSRSQEGTITDLAILRLNEPVVEHEETVAPWPPPGGLAPGEDPFEKPETLVHEPEFLLVDTEPAPERFRITRERAMYISVITHLLLLLVLVTVKLPERKLLSLDQTPDPLGILTMMRADPTPPPIPIQFFPAPGRKAPAPGPRPLPSDQDRVAHGGDPKLPKLTQPKAVPKPGIQDLDPGKKGPLAAAPQPVPPAEFKSQVGMKGETPRSGMADPEAVAHQRPDVPPKLKGIPEQVLAGLTAEQAARAAREVGGGTGGDDGGGYDREGGFVDSGPLSFDTAGYDWGAYAAEMIRKIKRNWDIPTLAHYGIKGRLTIRFFILKDGRVEAERILSSSGIPPYDNSSFQAIAVSSPFRPLPADLGKDREGVTITFFYNIRPEDLEEPARRPDPRRR